MGMGSLCRHRMSKTSSRKPSIVAIRSERSEDRYTASCKVVAQLHASCKRLRARTFWCGNSATTSPCLDRFSYSLRNTSENAKGINNIRNSMYTHAHTSPKLSGLHRGQQTLNGLESKDGGAHRCIICLQKISALQVRLDELGSYGGYEVYGA